MRIIEYKYKSITIGNRISRLQRLSKDGWEVVKVSSYGCTTRYRRVTLRKQVNE